MKMSMPMSVRAALAALVLGAATAGATDYPGRVWEPGPARYGAQVEDEVAVTMDDGVVLRASIAYPTDLASGRRAAGNFPVVIEHTPYVRLGQPVVPNTYLTEHGYIYAVVRARGTGSSGGEVQHFGAREGLDGKAIIDWAAHRLAQSDGRVGLIGCSYPGGIALTDAAHAGPASPLKVVVAACIGLDAQPRQVWMVNGLPTASLSNFPPRTPVLLGTNPNVAKFFTQFTDDVMAGRDPAYARDFWRDRLPLTLAQKIVDNGIPVLLWSGWGDQIETGALRTYTALQNAYAGRALGAPMAPGQATTPRYQIIMGNWQHAGGLDAGIYLEWLDTWLKGIDTGLQNSRAPMHLFEPGTDRWLNVAQYPLVAASTRWYLGRNAKLTTARPQGRAEAPLRFGDPDGQDGRLRFETPVLDKGMTLAGPISASIYASSSNTNLELIAKLYDLAPDGTSTLVSRGALLGSMSALDSAQSWTDRHGIVTWPWPKLDRDVYLRPGQVYRFDVSLAPRQWAIAPGHRLRFELITQNPASICPPQGPPPRNDADPCRLTAPQQATLPGGRYRIRLAGQWPSALNLPQLPWKALPAVPDAVLPTAWNENQRKLETRSVSLPLDWGGDK
jgi:predicted acyl esterase